MNNTHIFSLVCHEKVKILSFLEGELKKSERQEFVKHLETCEPCNQSLKVLRTEFDEIESLCPELLPEEKLDEALNFEVKEIVDIFFKRHEKEYAEKLGQNKSGVIQRISKTIGLKGFFNDLNLELK